MNGPSLGGKKGRGKDQSFLGFVFLEEHQLGIELQSLGIIKIDVCCDVSIKVEGGDGKTDLAWHS